MAGGATKIQPSNNMPVQTPVLPDTKKVIAYYEPGSQEPLDSYIFREHVRILPKIMRNHFEFGEDGLLKPKMVTS